MRRQLATTAVGLLFATAGVAASGCTEASDRSSKFPAHFKERYGSPDNEASWYRHVTGIEMVDGHVEITTDLSPNDERTETTGLAICRAATTLALDLGQLGDGKIEAAYVKATDGGGIVGCA